MQPLVRMTSTAVTGGVPCAGLGRTPLRYDPNGEFQFGGRLTQFLHPAWSLILPLGLAAPEKPPYEQANVEAHDEAHEAGDEYQVPPAEKQWCLVL